MGYVYKFTHKNTGKWYIGSRKGNSENDKYYGSGHIWKKALKKYGIESFNKEILYEGADFRLQETKILENLNAKDDPMSYNMKNFAFGGPFLGKDNGMFGKKLSKEQKYKCGNAFRGKKRPEHSKKMSGKGNPMYGKNEQAKGLIEHGKKSLGKTYEEIHGPKAAKELKNKLSISHLGKKYNLIKKICPHCKKEGSGPNMSRHHFDKCKKVI